MFWPHEQILGIRKIRFSLLLIMFSTILHEVMCKPSESLVKLVSLDSIPLLTFLDVLTSLRCLLYTHKT